MTDDPAFGRYMILNLVRIAGMLMVLAGVAIHYDRIDLPQVFAYVLAAAGLLGFFYLPRVLARRWRTPEK